MSVKFYQRNITVNGKTFPSKFYLGDPDDFCIEPTFIANSTDAGNDAKTWGDQGVYGTNASFFGLDANKKGYMSALHIYDNKNMVDKNGFNLYGNTNLETSSDNASAFDFLYYTGSSVGVKSKTGSWYNTQAGNQGISTMQWGIGGFNMLLSNTTINSETSFNNALVANYPQIKAAYKDPVSRTAIGYRGGTDKKIVLAACFGSNFGYSNGPTMYEIRLIMNYLGCSIALCLDGSNCTKISYKENGSNKGIDNGGRQTWCRIRLKTAAAATTDWTGV